jgi:hypothetical protein
LSRYIASVDTSESARAPDERPRVTASFVEPDEVSTSLLIAIGRAIVAAAGLEKALQVELAGILYERHTVAPNPELGVELARSDNLTAGQLLARLRDLDLPADLDARVADAIDRRNQLVHHTLEDPELAKAVLSGARPDAVVRRLDELACDCAALTVEMQLVAVPRLHAALGKSPSELMDMIGSIDPNTVSAPRERDQLEAIRAFADLDGLAQALDDLGAID